MTFAHARQFPPDEATVDVQCRPETVAATVLDSTELQHLLAEIATTASFVDVTVHHAPRGQDERSLRLHHVYRLLLEHRVHAVTIAYRTFDTWRRERFERSPLGVVRLAQDTWG